MSQLTGIVFLSSKNNCDGRATDPHNGCHKVCFPHVRPKSTIQSFLWMKQALNTSILFQFAPPLGRETHMHTIILPSFL